ncbi:DUF443 family protein [Streptococcus sanguinis]|uniref:Tandem five-TM protein n=1 Tax=Streptococcus sanguinis TaxID=1305 RepID=A0A2X3YMN8_STRSA|nr:DUF443 family protein [Streptococcus sanguinis]SQF71907.1 tandem five-TM protein [Streptococcus sanguinis]
MEKLLIQVSNQFKKCLGGNLELKFKYSNIAVFRIVNFENKQYILDPTSIRGKSYFFGLLPKEVTVDMIELSSSNESFEIKSKTPLGISTVAILVQPLVGISYRLMKEAFIGLGIIQQLSLKLGVFAFSMILSYLMAICYEKVAIRKYKSRIPKNSRRYRFVFEPKGKRMIVWYFIFVINIICLAFFMGTDNGSEGALLVINGIISWFYFVMMRMPQVPSYYKTLSLNKIEEL